MLIRALLLGGLAVAGSCGSSSEPTISTHVTPDTTTTPFVPPVTPAAKGWVKGAVSGAGLTNPYQVFVPLNYDASRKWPVILFLHSSTEKGLDNVLQTTVGLGPVIKAQESTFPAIAVFPQVGKNESERGGYLRVGMAALDSVLKVYNGDPTRIYLTGISAGGVYAFEMLHLNKTRFAAFMPMAADICPVCITGNSNSTQADAALVIAKEMPTMAYWQFQGSIDCCIPVQEARDITNAWKTVNPAVKYTEYAGVGHGQTHEHAYIEPTIFTWLFAQHR
ncbi:MAG: phospholipase/carboxylesterase [Gemmatimonadetes bacterium]|nr:phospholipase/carboxylesterase [Gemmatimonadota bacterium]